jgi:hypothetical protein
MDPVEQDVVCSWEGIEHTSSCITTGCISMHIKYPSLNIILMYYRIYNEKDSLLLNPFVPSKMSLLVYKIMF